MFRISVVVSAYNEEKNIRTCLESVKDFASEVIVVDNESEDRTAQIAKDLGAVVYSQPNNPMLNLNKNYGFSKANGDWILNLDADETTTPELNEEIKNNLNSLLSTFNSQINGFWISRKNFIFGKWIEHSFWWPDMQLRLFKKGKGQFPGKLVHEYLEVSGETSSLKNPLIHQNYSSISQFLRKMEQIYTENEAQNLIDQNYQTQWQEILKAPASDFLKNYFSKEGYKDGKHGLVLNLLQSYVPLVVLAKVWEKEGFPAQEIKLSEIKTITDKLIREVNYWLLTVEMENSKSALKKFYLKVKRKIG